MRQGTLWTCVVVVLALSVMLTGCGGGGSTAETPSSGTSAGGAAPLPPPVPPVVTSSGGETATAVPFQIRPDTPKFFADLIALKTPLVVVFYSASDPAWSDVSKEVAAVETRYGNQAEFLRLSMDDSYNMASLPSSKQRAAQEVTNLAEQFGVKFTPYVVVVDRNATITYTHSGYIDTKTLEQELFKALKR